MVGDLLEGFVFNDKGKRSTFEKTKRQTIPSGALKEEPGTILDDALAISRLTLSES